MSKGEKWGLTVAFVCCVLALESAAEVAHGYDSLPLIRTVMRLLSGSVFLFCAICLVTEVLKSGD